MIRIIEEQKGKSKVLFEAPNYTDEASQKRAVLFYYLGYTRALYSQSNQTNVFYRECDDNIVRSINNENDYSLRIDDDGKTLSVHDLVI